MTPDMERVRPDGNQADPRSAAVAAPSVLRRSPDQRARGRKAAHDRLDALLDVPAGDTVTPDWSQYAMGIAERRAAGRALLAAERGWAA